jgi:hypothetical protein
MGRMMDGRHLTRHPVPPPGAAAEQHGYQPVSRHATGDELCAALLAAALWWAEARGLWVFPCEIGGKSPAVPRGFKSATRDRVVIRGWWENEYAGCNIGGRNGYPGPDALDVEGYGKPGGDGWAAFERLKQAGLLAGAHRMVRTPSGGLHLYFTGTDQRCGSIKAEHIDYKAQGGYVLLPPSQVDGRPYEVIDERPPTGATLSWDACRAVLCPAPAVRRVWVGRHGGRVDHLPEWLAGQAQGNRNSALHWAACRAAEAGDQAVLDELVAAGVQAGLDETEARRTVASAVRSVGSG